MDLINNVLGGDGQKKSKLEDFIGRYQQGSPHEGVSDDEALQHYQQVAPQLSDGQYQESAEASFARLSPEERQQFAQFMKSRAQQQGITDFDGADEQLQDPRQLAQMTTQVRKRDPNILEQLMGRGGSGGTFDNPIAKAAFAGIAAMAASRLMGRH